MVSSSRGLEGGRLARWPLRPLSVNGFDRSMKLCLVEFKPPSVRNTHTRPREGPQRPRRGETGKHGKKTQQFRANLDVAAAFPGTPFNLWAKPPTTSPTQNKITQLILIFRMRWTRAALRAAFSDGFSEAFLFSLATIRAFRLSFR